MPYLNIVGSFPLHPRTIAAGNAAIGLWARAGAWSAENKKDGLIPDEIARALGKPSEIRRLVETGWWEPGPAGGYIMHDYDDHNITAAQAAELSRKRAEAGRKGGSVRPGLQAIKGGTSG